MSNIIEHTRYVYIKDGLQMRVIWRDNDRSPSVVFFDTNQHEVTFQFGADLWALAERMMRLPEVYPGEDTHIGEDDDE